MEASLYHMDNSQYETVLGVLVAIVIISTTSCVETCYSYDWDMRYLDS